MWSSDFLLVLWIWKHEFLAIVNAPYFTTGYNFKLLCFCISAIVLFGSIRGSIWTIIYVIAASSSISVVAKRKLRIEAMKTSVADLTIFNSEMLYRVMRVSPIFLKDIDSYPIFKLEKKFKNTLTFSDRCGIVWIHLSRNVICTHKKRQLYVWGLGLRGGRRGLAAVTFLSDTWENSIFLLKKFGLFENILERDINSFCLKFIGQFLLFFTKFILFI